MRQRVLVFAVPVAAILASACGGGGGGGGGTGGGTVTRANAELVAENAVGATVALDSLAFLNQDILDLVGAPAPRLSNSSGRSVRRTTRLLPRVPRAAALLGGEQTMDCDSGTATVRVDDAAPLEQLSPGDTGSITYGACVLQGTTLGGAVAFQVIQNDTFPVTPFRIEIAYTIDNLSAADSESSETIGGSFNMIATNSAQGVFETAVTGGPLTLDEQLGGQSTRVTLSGFNASTTRNGDTYRVDVHNATLSVASAGLNGSMTFETTEPLVGTGDNPPSGGEIHVAGEASNLWIRALNSTQAQVLVDTNGDGTPDGDPIPTTWDALGL